MSKTYKVVSGDTLVKISTKQYGTYTKWRQILSANPQLAGRKKSYDGVPILNIGDVLIIPSESDAPKTVVEKPILVSDSIKIEDCSEDDFSVFIEGKLFTGFTGYTIKLSVDTLDAFSFSCSWEEKKEVRDAFVPFTFKECAVYFKRKLVFLGRLLTSAPEVSPDSRTINIQGYPLCGTLNDCCIPVTKYPPSYNGMTLKQIAEDICQPFGVGVEFSEDSGNPIDKVEYEIGTKILDFLKKLSEQRNFIFTNSPNGGLFFWKVSEESTLAVFNEGELPFISCKVSFKQQEMYSHLTGFSKTDKKNAAAQYTYENQFLIKKGVFRPFSFICEDVKPNELEKAVKAKAGQMFVNCCSYTLTVYGCTDRDGDIFHKGMSVSVYAPSALIYRPTKFQVSEIEIKKSDSEGVQTTFSLILPDSINGTIPSVLPWEE